MLLQKCASISSMSVYSPVSPRTFHTSGKPRRAVGRGERQFLKSQKARSRTCDGSNDVLLRFIDQCPRTASSTNPIEILRIGAERRPDTAIGRISFEPHADRPRRLSVNSISQGTYAYAVERDGGALRQLSCSRLRQRLPFLLRRPVAINPTLAGQADLKVCARPGLKTASGLVTDTGGPAATTPHAAGRASGERSQSRK